MASNISKKAWVTGLILALVSLQSNAFHIHPSANHTHGDAAHQHDVAVHTHFSVNHHADSLDDTNHDSTHSAANFEFPTHHTANQRLFQPQIDAALPSQAPLILALDSGPCLAQIKTGHLPHRILKGNSQPRAPPQS